MKVQLGNYTVNQEVRVRVNMVCFTLLMAIRSASMMEVDDRGLRRFYIKAIRQTTTFLNLQGMEMMVVLRVGKGMNVGQVKDLNNQEDRKNLFCRMEFLQP